MNGDDVVLVSAIEHYDYCPRQCALIHVDGVWAENRHTVRGARGHRRADTPGSRVERGRTVVRAMPVFSEVYGLSGRADAVVFAEDDVVPIEYKIGTYHRAAELQLCAIALCLEEMFDTSVRQGFLWIGGARRRREIALTDQLRADTIRCIDRIRVLPSAALLPPAVDDRRCDECQLQFHCLPKVVANPDRVSAYVANEVMSCA